MNLSPSAMKDLLHHILSGKEFGVERSGKFKELHFCFTVLYYCVGLKLFIWAMR